MCGIVGAVSLDGRPLDTRRLQEMVDVVAHRGPDDAGYYLWQKSSEGGLSLTDNSFHHIRPDLGVIDSAEGAKQVSSAPWSVFLGHRRLSIIDLSPSGHQPMTDASGRVCLVYNGEIYNFRELRSELQGRGRTFRGHSDTEVLLEAYLTWGSDCVERLNGMFAFAVWDARDRKLLLARDRYGIKPLYYRQVDGTLLFGSEVKSILRYSDAPTGVDLLALNEYFSFQNIFTDRTLFEGVRLLAPGHTATLDLDAGELRPRRYWDFDFQQESGDSPENLRKRLVELLSESVVRQCVSDVPVASYLSGGMDSGTITAIAARELGRIHSFTVGFDLSEAADHEMAFDEREVAERMSNAFRTEHSECILHSGDLESAMDDLIWHLEDPRVGQSYPNWYAAKLASRFGKVVLTGTGGDELFGGYPWRYAAALAASPDGYAQNYYRYWQRLVSNRDKRSLFAPAIADQLGRLREGDAVPFENHTLAVFEAVFGAAIRPKDAADQVRHSLYFECKTFLHGLLIVEDKLSMAHSLETRVPFLDNELLDFACTVPIDLKVTGIDELHRMNENLPGDKRARYDAQWRSGKSILRDAMADILPKSISGARKQGFSGPDESWFRGQAEGYVRGVLLDPSTRIYGYLDRAYVEGILDQHSRGDANRRLLIWSLLSFEKWLQHFQ